MHLAVVCNGFAYTIPMETVQVVLDPISNLLKISRQSNDDPFCQKSSI